MSLRSSAAAEALQLQIPANTPLRTATTRRTMSGTGPWHLSVSVRFRARQDLIYHKPPIHFITTPATGPQPYTMARSACCMPCNKCRGAPWCQDTGGAARQCITTVPVLHHYRRAHVGIVLGIAVYGIQRAVCLLPKAERFGGCETEKGNRRRTRAGTEDRALSLTQERRLPWLRLRSLI